MRSVAAAFSASMVRVTSVPDATLAGTVKVTVPRALPPLPAVMVTVLGEVEENLRSLLTRTVNVPVVSEDTMKGMEMVEPRSMLMLSAWAWKNGGGGKGKFEERGRNKETRHFFTYFI